MLKGRSLRLAVITGLCALLGLSGSAQGPSAPSLSQEDMRTWLTYLASDELQGRQVYSEGLGLAATYIADHLRQWGVQPAGDGGSFFQSVRVQGVRTRSRSSVTVTVNGQSKTFTDGEGVTFPRNQGAKQTLAGTAEFAGYGVTFPELRHDDYAGRTVTGKVAIALGRKGPHGFTAAHNRILGARGRLATDTHRAIAFITEAADPPANPPANAAPAPAAAGAQRVDFQTAQRLDSPISPLLTAGQPFLEFLFSASGTSYEALKTAADRQEPLPDVALDNVSIAIKVDADYDVVQTRLTRNVVGRVAGSDPALRDSHVLLGAHYDHLGYEQFGVNQRVNAIAACTGQTRPTPRPGDIIINGADDDGSGTVTLMALARSFSRAPTRRSLLFVWHTAEEAGLSGSRYMADHPLVPLEKISAQLNIDMVGRNNCDDQAESNTVYVVGSDRISTELHNLNEDANSALTRPLTLNYLRNDPSDLESIYTRSDHFSYAAKGIPIIFYTTGLHRDYHFVTDEVDKIEFAKMVRIAGLIQATATRVGNLGHLPVRDNRGPRRGAGQSGRID